MPDTPRMTPLFLHLLLALLDGPRHGYALMQEIEARTAGRVRLGPSSLYYALGRILDAGWIEETADVTEDTPHEERRRYYRLTPAGRQRLGEETTLLADLLAHARARGLA